MYLVHPAAGSVDRSARSGRPGLRGVSAGRQKAREEMGPPTTLQDGWARKRKGWQFGYRNMSSAGTDFVSITFSHSCDRI